MIHFNYDWSQTLNQLIVILAIALLAMQLWLIIFNDRSQFSRRKAIRLVLNVLLWMAIAGFILQPYVKKDSTSVTGLIIGEDVSPTFEKEITDSLKTAEVISPDFQSLQDLESLNALDTIVLVGQKFDSRLFPALILAENHPDIKWISHTGLNQIEDLNWKGIVRKGEMQTVRGDIESSENQLLKLVYGNQTLDSLQLNKGNNRFKLAFPVFSQGRTLATLQLDNKSIDTIRFFARPTAPLTFQFILNNPDFESRNLATWLGKNGHSVLYSTKLSTDIKSEQTINKAKEPDVIVTDSRNATNPLVKKAVTNGKSVLFINLNDPASEITTVNNALGAKLQIRKISNENAITLSPELTALPYQFVQSNHYQTFPKYPVAVVKKAGKIGVSLLNETFPMMLTGDSISYGKIWNSILAAVRPAMKSNIEIQAPVYQKLKATLRINNFTNSPRFLRMATDTLFLDYSAINERSASATFTPTQSGWISLADSSNTELFLEPEYETGNNYNSVKLKDFLSSYTSFQSKRFEAATRLDTDFDRGVKKRLSPWLWFGLVMICLVGVWVEGKL